MQTAECRDSVREQLLEFAWSEWAQMGLSGHGTRADSRAMDPEALLLLTIEVARRDPRLFDELLDWVATNGSFLSPNRLRHLMTRHPGDTGLIEAVLAWTSTANPGLRRRPPDPSSRPELIDVFASDVATFSPQLDPAFEAYGFRRPPVRRNHKSRTPDLRKPINFSFRLRSLFGTGTRAEVVRILLTSEEPTLNVSRIAHEAAFAKRNINETLLALVRADVVKARWAGNERLFAADRTSWAQLLHSGTAIDPLPGHAPWIDLLRALTAVHVWLERADEEWSPYMAASEARRLIDGIAADLDRAGVRADRGARLSGESYWPAFEEIVQELVEIVRVAGATRKRRHSA